MHFWLHKPRINDEKLFFSFFRIKLQKKKCWIPNAKSLPPFEWHFITETMQILMEFHGKVIKKEQFTQLYTYTHTHALRWQSIYIYKQRKQKNRNCIGNFLIKWKVPA